MKISKTSQEAVLRLAISLAAAAVIIGSGAAEAAWKEHPYKDLGFVVEFPDEPKVGSGNYKTVLVPSANVHIYSQKQDNALFVASVVDLQERAGDGASLMSEAEFNLTLLGDISDNSISRVERGGTPSLATSSPSIARADAFPTSRARRKPPMPGSRTSPASSVRTKGG